MKAQHAIEYPTEEVALDLRPPLAVLAIYGLSMAVVVPMMVSAARGE